MPSTKIKKKMVEEFRDILGYEELYQVSNLGRVRSLQYGKERILKPCDSAGYCKVSIQKDGVKKGFKVHQLVAIAFLNHTPCGYDIVINHIDGNRKNNTVENLELISSAENTVDGLLRNNNKPIEIKNNIKYISIKQFEAYYTYNDEQILIGSFESIKECTIAIESANKIVNILKTKNPVSN